MSAQEKQQRALLLISRVLTITSVVVLIVGIVVLIGSFSATANLSYSLIGLQILGGEALMNLITPLLRSALTGAGVLVFVIALVLSLILYTTGRFATYTLHQSLRLEKAEQALQQLEREVSKAMGNDER